MGATHTKHADKIRWSYRGDDLGVGVSRFGEYLIPEPSRTPVVFRRWDGSREPIPAPSTSEHHVYQACVNHNKRLLGID